MENTNPYVLGGHRNCTTCCGCLLSIGELHNDTVNILTHLVPALYLTYTLFTSQWQVAKSFEASSSVYEKAEHEDVLITQVAAAVVCFTLSSLYHIFRCLSVQAYNRWLKVDLFGVTVMMAGSVLTPIYVGFACWSDIRKFYFIGFAIIFVVIGVLFSAPRLYAPHWLNVGLRVAAILFTLCPLVHWTVLSSHEEVEKFLWQLLVTYLLYAAGVCFFVGRIPERWMPGRFDIWGHSHQWWHVILVLAAAWSITMLDAIGRYRLQNQCRA